jgi:hypothetical protein
MRLKLVVIVATVIVGITALLVLIAPRWIWKSKGSTVSRLTHKYIGSVLAERRSGRLHIIVGTNDNGRVVCVYQIYGSGSHGRSIWFRARSKETGKEHDVDIRTIAAEGINPVTGAVEVDVKQANYREIIELSLNVKDVYSAVREVDDKPSEHIAVDLDLFPR